MFKRPLVRWLKSLGREHTTKPRRLQVESLETRLAPSIDLWLGAQSSHWSDSMNWSLRRPPGASDIAAFTAAQPTNKVENPQSEDDIANLTIAGVRMDSTWANQGGTLWIDGTLTLSGNSVWDSGAISVGGVNGPGTLINLGTINMNAPVNVAGGAVCLTGGGTLINNGVMVQRGAPLRIEQSANATSTTLSNSASGLIQVQGTYAIMTVSAAAVVNYGTIERIGGMPSSWIDIPVTNRGGTIEDQSGTLQMSLVTDFNGTFQLDKSTCILSFAPGPQGATYLTENGTFVAKGYGKILLETQVSTGDHGGAFNMPPGVLCTWTGEMASSIQVPAGANLIYNGLLSIVTASHFGYDCPALGGQGTFTIEGTAVQTGSAALGLGNGSTASLDIPQGAIYDIQNNSGIFGDGGTIVNAGTIEKTGGTGTSTIAAAMTDVGVIAVKSGTLAVTGDQFHTPVTSIGAVFDVESGRLRLGNVTDTNGVFNLVTKTSVLDLTEALLGVNDAFTENGTFTATGAGQILLETQLDAGSQGATFVIPPSVSCVWTNDGFGSDIQVPLGKKLVYQGNLVLNKQADLEGGGTFILEGTLNQTGAGYLFMGNDVNSNPASLSIALGSTYDIQGNHGTYSGSTGAMIVNFGSVEKAVGTTTAAIASPLDNEGVMAVYSGTLSVTGQVKQVDGKTLTGGSWLVSAGSTGSAVLNIYTPISVIGAAASVTLDGPNARFANLAGLNTNQGNFSLLEAKSFTSFGNFTNAGTLTLSPGSVLTVNGKFTELAAGILNLQMEERAAVPRSGASPPPTAARCRSTARSTSRPLLCPPCSRLSFC
jgi:hypothetical protein